MLGQRLVWPGPADTDNFEGNQLKRGKSWRMTGKYARVVESDENGKRVNE